MSKKLIYLVSFVLLLSAAGNASADLLVHWRLDEGSGTIAFDSSGNGNDGTFSGEPQWVDGHGGGGALEFDGVDDFVVYSFDQAQTFAAFSVAFWVKASSLGQPNYASPFTGHYPNTAGFQIDVDGGNPGNYRINPNSGIHFAFGTATTDWVHLALTAEGTSMNLYYNGNWASSNTLVDTDVVFNQFAIGVNRNRNWWFAGTIDELRVYDHVLSEAEIMGAMEGEIWPYAFGPEPADGTLHEATWANVSWKPGGFAVSHDVYFGENFDDVNDGTEGTFLGNQATTKLIVGFLGFPYPDGLVPGTTYYWRIDEVNDLDPNSPWKGDVWSFTIPPRTAYNPEPADGVKFVKPDVELNWTGGFGAKLHHVYFGDNFDDVNSAVVGLPQAETTYTPGTLELDKVYYWCIDEFDGVNTHKGDVFSFRTMPEIPITDPDLICWWKLDEGSGTNALDWSGHGNHGTLTNGLQWVDGYDGGALDFDGINDSVIYRLADEETWSAYTVALWVKAGSLGQRSNNCVFASYNSSAAGFQLSVDGTNPGNYQYHTDPIDQIMGPVTLDWIHLAATCDGISTTLYCNGYMVASIGAADLVFNKFAIGVNRNEDQLFDGTIDNLRIYNKVLTAEEIQQAMRGDPLVAWGPNPSPGSTPYIRDATPLSWSPGDNASQHDVYFGTDRGAVVDADASDTTGIYQGRQGVTIYTPAKDVEWGGGPYYWRIDEYNTDATISKGSVWSFTVADSIGIDDFEDYNDYPPDEIFSTWIDGWEVPTNGSMAGHADPPFAETSIVHGGGQSMPLYYENNFKYSEAAMTLVSVRDWTEEGVGVLSLWFYGDASNAAERMYVALNGSAVVYHDNPDAALIDEWTEWTIDLQAFTGVNLANVNTISIGFGDKNNLQAGGSGMVLFDDIRLYRPMP